MMREPQRWGVSRGRAVLAAWPTALCVLVAASTPALALIKYGPLQLSGNLETQELVRTPNIDTYQFVQGRNTFRLRVDLDWVQNGKFLDNNEIPLIERSKLFLLYRGVYDGFYDLTPSDLQRGQTRYDDFVGGRITNLSASRRQDRAFENDLREAYVDFKLKDAPLSFRFGRQQVIWGESDQFRLMDIWNPLDITWHFQQESWDNIRIPLWLLKGLWDIGELGPLSNTFLEVVYNPGDFHTGIEVGFLPLPWALPFADPLRAGQITSVSQGTRTALLSPTFNLQGTSYQKGDFKSDPADASEVGTRFHAVTPQGIEFSLNYLYARGRGVGAASPFGVRISSVDLPALPPEFGGTAKPIGTYQKDVSNAASVANVYPIDINAQVVDPYMHIFGLTGNYFEGDFTQAVLRLETAYVLGEPYQTIVSDSLVPVTVAGKNIPGLGLGTSPLGYTTRDIWAGMVGFDRPTWIRWLNSKATWFITAQFFWNYVSGGGVSNLRGTSGAGDSPYFGPIGQWVSSTNPSTASFPGTLERQQNGKVLGNGDQIRQWEHLITLAGTSFYRGGTVVPFVADAWDPIDDNNEVLWNVDYYYRNDLIITLEQKFFFTYGSSAPSNDPWYAGGRFARRDEAGIKVTYQF